MTENEARKRPQSVGCVAGETTYWPMEMAVLEIGCIQGKRKPGPGCVSIKGSQLAAALQCNWATRMSQKAASAGG